MEVAPTGQAILVVQKGKKASKAELYSVYEKERTSAKFDAGKYGQPVSAAFLPDGRSVAIATDHGIFLADARTLKPNARVTGIEGGIPSEMTVSPNGYFLACVLGDDVAVYNLQEKTLRKKLDLGETVTSVAFSPDNSDMGVLTSDGVLSIYSTRTFDLRKMADGLGDGIAFDYNLDGKYVAVATAPDQIVVVNLLNDSDRETYNLEGTGLSMVKFTPDSRQNTVMTYGLSAEVQGRRLYNLMPFFNKLINEETDRKMDEWLKMMPGETMEQYRMRVSDEARAQKRMMFEYEISTLLAGNILAGKSLTIGAYDREKEVLALDFESMPTIFLPVPQAEATAFRNPADLSVEEVLYGVNPDDSFDIVYARILNAANGKTYTFDNRQRASLDYLKSDNMISIEVLQQQQMEEQRLHELREQVMREAKSQNVISDHTNIMVDSRLVPDYDANGNKILNYEVSFTYEVEPDFSAREDFGPGKYHINESGAATSMAKIVKEAFEGDMKPYLERSKGLKVQLTGSADATPIMHGIAYDGAYGEFDQEPVYVGGQLSALTVNARELMKTNPQLAFVRALGIRNFLENQVAGFKGVNPDYRYEVNVSEGKGSEFRRINLKLTFIDAFK